MYLLAVVFCLHDCHLATKAKKDPMLQVNAAILTLTEDVCLPELADAAKVLALELGGLEVDASWLEGELCVDVTSADIMAHDLSSLHLGTSDTILMRWTDGMSLLQAKGV